APVAMAMAAEQGRAGREANGAAQATAGDGTSRGHARDEYHAPARCALLALLPAMAGGLLERWLRVRPCSLPPPPASPASSASSSSSPSAALRRPLHRPPASPSPSSSRAAISQPAAISGRS